MSYRGYAIAWERIRTLAGHLNYEAKALKLEQGKRFPRWEQGVCIVWGETKQDAIMRCKEAIDQLLDKEY